MSRRVELLAPAKLNLGLELVARRSDGYHDIQTVFLPLRLYDRLVIEPTPDRGVSLDVGSADLSLDAENLAVRAAEAVCQALDPQLGVRIELRKQIPIAAGLGGGSSDAAAALMGVEALAAEPLDPERRAAIARTLGADVPFFLNPVPCVGRGIGDQLEPLPGLPEMHWVLVAFPFGVSTPWAYREASRELTLPRHPSSIAALLGPGGPLASPRNDLEGVATRRHPQIRASRLALEAAGATITGMSGSGPTVYGRFRSAKEASRVSRELKVPEGATALAVSSPASDAANWDWGVAKW